MSWSCSPHERLPLVHTESKFTLSQVAGKEVGAQSQALQSTHVRHHAVAPVVPAALHAPLQSQGGCCMPCHSQ